MIVLARLQPPCGHRVADHLVGGAVLDRAARVHELALAPDLDAGRSRARTSAAGRCGVLPMRSVIRSATRSRARATAIVSRRGWLIGAPTTSRADRRRRAGSRRWRIGTASRPRAGVGTAIRAAPRRPPASRPAPPRRRRRPGVGAPRRDAAGRRRAQGPCRRKDTTSTPARPPRITTTGTPEPHRRAGQRSSSKPERTTSVASLERRQPALAVAAARSAPTVDAAHAGAAQVARGRLGRAIPWPTSVTRRARRSAPARRHRPPPARSGGRSGGPPSRSIGTTDQPPAMAGTIEISSESLTGVSRFLRKRMSSSLAKMFTKRRTWPLSSQMRSLMPGYCVSRLVISSPMVAPVAATSSLPWVSLRSGVGMRTVAMLSPFSVQVAWRAAVEVATAGGRSARGSGSLPTSGSCVFRPWPVMQMTTGPSSLPICAALRSAGWPRPASRRRRSR